MLRDARARGDALGPSGAARLRRAAPDCGEVGEEAEATAGNGLTCAGRYAGLDPTAGRTGRGVRQPPQPSSTAIAGRPSRNHPLPRERLVIVAGDCDSEVLEREVVCATLDGDASQVRHRRGDAVCRIAVLERIVDLEV